MVRSIVALILALVLQSVLTAFPMSMADRSQDSAHAQLHLQEEGHHHHDTTGLYHLDDSVDSTLHLMADHLSVSAVLPAGLSPLPRLDAGSPGNPRVRAGPPPYLAGLLRPPQATA